MGRRKVAGQTLITLSKEDITLFRKRYQNVRTFDEDEEIGHVSAGLSKTISASFQSIKMSAEVGMPVRASIKEKLLGLKLAFELAERGISEVLDKYKFELEELKNEFGDD